jgi:3-hydroxyisobutyrate dehydrogenase
MADRPLVGYIGLGIMGRPMVNNLLSAGYEVTVWNRSEPGIAECIEAGASRGTSPAQVAQSTDVVITCVTDSPDVEQVMLGDGGAIEGAREGLIVVDMSTISPDVTRQVSTAFANEGVSMLDAPVSGGDVGAIAGTLSIMVGGDKQTFDQVGPIFDVLGKTATYCGSSGLGQTVKLCNQIVGAVNILAMCEGLILGAKAGADMEALVMAVSNGAAGSWMMSNLAPKILQRDFDPGFMLKLQQKDLRLVMESAHALKVALPGAGLVHQLFHGLEADGLGDEGTQALAKALERLAGTQISA